jgi:hypothetical protein
MKRKRNYKKEYEDYQGEPEQIKERAARNKARRELMKQGRVRKGDNKDVAHRDDNELNNDPSNWRVESRKKNRANNTRERVAYGSKKRAYKK